MCAYVYMHMHASAHDHVSSDFLNCSSPYFFEARSPTDPSGVFGWSAGPMNPPISASPALG